MHLGPGALYGAITRLEERGLIEPLPPDDRRRPYRITAAGRRRWPRRSPTSGGSPTWVPVDSA